MHITYISLKEQSEAHPTSLEAQQRLQTYQCKVIKVEYYVYSSMGAISYLRGQGWGLVICYLPDYLHHIAGNISYT